MRRYYIEDAQKIADDYQVARNFILLNYGPKGRVKQLVEVDNSLTLMLFKVAEYYDKKATHVNGER